MRLSDKLKAKRTTLLEKLEALLETISKTESGEFTKEQADEYDGIEKDVARLDGEIDRAERAEKLAAKANSTAATEPTATERASRPPARVKESLKADRKVALSLAAQLKGAFSGQHALAVLDENGYGEFALELAEVNGITKSVNTLTPAAGGILMPQPARGELMELIYPETTFLQGNPQRVELTGGKYEQPFGVTGATAAYVGESIKKPVSDLTFDKMSMTSKKLAAIVLITKEAQRWLFPSIRDYVERNLRTVLPQTMNTAAYLGTGAGDTPLGILNTPGIGVYSATGRFVNPKLPTIQELDAIATLMAMHMTTRNIGRNTSWAWVAGARTLEWLRNFRIGTNLDLAFPTLAGPNPTFKGIRLLEEVAIPENLGGTTDETILSLINFNDVLFGEEEGLNTSFSDQATVDVSGTLVHLWQQNMFGLLAEMMHGFGVARVNSIVRLNNVRWGAP